ncbi:MAG: hypothetical protein KDA84_05560 [Planctomycetaceae bacterium]|nr:hypothetical protein [Planctomycetaceae bacterium]
MKPNVSRCLSVLLLLGTGCTYNRVCYDPSTGFHKGGGVEIQCGGPLDPWMQKCCPPGGGYDHSCTDAFCCAVRAFWNGTFCYPPVCGPGACSPPCGPMCAPSVCPPVCAPSVCAPPCGNPAWPAGIAPLTPLPTVPASPPVLSPTPQPIYAPTTFAAPESCSTCNAGSSVGGPVYSHPQSVAVPTPGVTNYPQLFQQHPPMAPPPTPPTGDQFVMPTPIPESEIPPTAEQLPPNYNMMDTPAAQAPPMNPMNPMNPMPPMNPMNPMPPMNPMTQPVPAEKPMPMPMGTPASQTSYPTYLPPNVMPAGMVNPAGGYPQGVIQDSRRQQWIPVRI